MSTAQVAAEAARRRTFAIISHPDAGKTTLTEKLLLYGGAIDLAGAVRAGKGGSHARSDWMDIERQRGISVTSTALRFEHRDRVMNLLDTPGHRDFSEDTYRVLAATDTAIMVIDAAKGLEPQTLKLFRVCRQRGTPIITFINKFDRPARDPLELMDEIEAQIGMRPTPVTWPVIDFGTLLGVVDRRDLTFIAYRTPAEGGGEADPVPLDEAGLSDDIWAKLQDDLDLLEAVGADHDQGDFSAGLTTPVFVGSALGDCGVRQLLEAVEDMGPPPPPWPTDDGATRSVDSPFSAVVFKVQANTDPRHRDRIAFMRVCSGRFERGLTVRHEPSDRTLGLRHAHQPFGQERIPVEEAFPGDVVGLVNAAGLRPGDTVFAEDSPVRFAPLPRFAPEHFAVVHNSDTSRYKQFRRGLEELDQEGVVLVLSRRGLGDQAPVLAAVGPMQLEVASARMAGEFGAPIQIAAPRQLVARETDEAGADLMARLGIEILVRRSGELVALFRSEHHVDSIQRDHPDLVLVRLLAG
ncbi:MAG: peptide chain release factor 3 [Miltoncostaeaceae bacterium]